MKPSSQFTLYESAPLGQVQFKGNALMRELLSR